eukprot:jgi/Picsp_1/1127/NSC_04608-R1_peptidase domain protein
MYASNRSTSSFQLSWNAQRALLFVLVSVIFCTQADAASFGRSLLRQVEDPPDPATVQGCGPGGGAQCIIGYKGGDPKKKCPEEEECKKCNEGNGVSGQCFCVPPKARFFKNEKCMPCTAPGYEIDTETGKCVCATDAGFVVNSQGDGCECDSEKNLVLGENGECVCDAANNFVPDGEGGCECDSEKNLVLGENGECVCDAANNFVPDGEGGCECDSEKNLVLGENGECVCDAANNFVPDGENGECVCDAANNFVPGENGECVCDAANNFVPDGEGGCECDSEKNLVLGENGECVCDAANNFVPDGENGECVCDAANNFVPGENGECVCKDGYTLKDGECIRDCSPSMTITPNKANPDVNEVVTFTIEAECFSTKDSQVTFKISYGDATGEQFQATPTCDSHVCSAETSSPSHAYSYASQFAVTASLEDTSGTILSTGTIISVGQSTVINNYTLPGCGSYVRSTSGGPGGTIDEWDISAISPGSKIDVFLETFNIPDRLILQYDNTQQLDTKWVGSKGIYDANPTLYPGPYAQASTFEQEDVFTTTSKNKFTVFVLAPQSGTVWFYQIKC